ncbi:MAG TPA: 1-acyl-sn-glycerol-3-phosphate acyltransferase [Candidatus Limnocylindrales bacterium]|nr:1-acyl-sn-glycerol-3-phosphate acyltransferase [Candidatus Limnocylindrales bacterium]
MSTSASTAAVLTPLDTPPPFEPHPSAMRRRMNRIAEFVGRRLFGRAVVNERLVEKIRALSELGTIVYVLRHHSFVDYFMINFILRREDLPLPVFANGVMPWALAPLREMFRNMRSSRGGKEEAEAVLDQESCAAAVASGRPVMVFMRGPREGGATAAEHEAAARAGGEYLRHILPLRDSREIFIVPLAPFRGHSFRRRDTGLAAVVYNAHEVMSEFRKLITYWVFRRDLFLTVGTEVGLREFAERYPRDSEDRLVKRLTRAIQIFLYREERVVMGPAIMSRRKIKSILFGAEATRTFIASYAAEHGVAEAKVRKRAESIFDEMAAEYNSAIFSVVSWTFIKIWHRMFQGLETIGFETVIEKAKHHPIVMVPCHRSHLDYLILSYLFHLNFVSPPHIAAGVNMGFGLMGPILRASGAYFIRRSFGDDEVYKHVFSVYLQFLIREGYTQEFFIEGGRSRTGKIMTPKLGMLAAIVNAYSTGMRRDLYLVPVSIHYGRIVEEEAYQAELAGAEKEPESMSGLMRARRFLKQKYGSVYVSFAEPISLSDELGDRKQRFGEKAGDPEVEEEKRRFIQRLGFRILREVNGVAVAGATSVSATVLLGATHWGFRYRDFRERADELYRLIVFLGIRPTSSLSRNAGTFRESMGFLSANRLIEVLPRGREEVLVVQQGRRMALDFYKNNLIHAFLVPSLAVTCLREGVPLSQLVERIWSWLDLFRYEFPLPSRSTFAAQVDRFLTYLEEVGAYRDGVLDAAHPLSAALMNVLQNFREAYYVQALTCLHRLGTDGLSEKALLEEVRKYYKTCLLLGEVTKSEGAGDVTLRNALSRFIEMGFVRSEGRGRGGREKWIVRGAEWPALEPFVIALEESLRIHAAGSRF